MRHSTSVSQLLEAVTSYDVNMTGSSAGSSGVPRIFFFLGGGSTNSVEDRGQRER
jgi:hypothetical protein